MYNIYKKAFCAFILIILSLPIFSQQQNLVSIDWNKIIVTSKTTPTLQVVENPYLRKNSPIHDATFEALKNLGANYVRYVPWFPYPKMAVAELKPPTRLRPFGIFLISIAQ